MMRDVAQMTLFAHNPEIISGFMIYLPILKRITIIFWIFLQEVKGY
jgi:hypothetical protein